MSENLTVKWSGGERSFSPGTEVRIGRDVSCQVVVDNPNVSRHHVSITHGSAGWTLEDRGSAQGTFLEGRVVSRTAIQGRVSVVLGSPKVGEHVELSTAVSTGAGAAETRARAGEDLADTVVPDRARPGGALRDQVFDAATVVRGPSLRIECGGSTLEFSPGRRITIGRDADADVVCTNPTVSRRHATIFHDGSVWRIEDADSATGISIDGRKLKGAALTGSTAVWLGDQDTGERLVVVAGGEKPNTSFDRVRKASRSKNLAIGAAAAALLAFALAAYALVSNGQTTVLDRDQLARGVVRIETSEGSVGSGTVVDAELGLILTNAHLAAPRAEGQGVARDLLSSELGENPRTISVWVSDGIDKIAEPRYQAEVEVVDGYLDLAVLRITRTSGGALIEEGDLDGLVAIPIGDSSEVGSGDAIQILGHPTVAQSNAATFTTGVLAGPVQDTRIGSNRAFINLDAEIRPGNSGGLVANVDGEIIGVPTLNWIEDSNDIGAMRPILFAEPLIEAAREGTEYASPYISPLTGNEKLPTVAIGIGADAGFRTGCNTRLAEAGAGDRALSLHVDYEGFTAGTHQDMAVAIIDAASGDPIAFATTGRSWPMEFEGSGCLSVGLRLSRPLAPGIYYVDFYLGPNYEFDDSMSFVFEI